MDPMKSRRWIAAAALAAAVVFLVMVTGEHGPAAPEATPAAVSSSGTVQPSGGGPPDKDKNKNKDEGDAHADGGGDGSRGGGGGKDADREEVIGAVQDLLDALGISAEELADAAGNNSCGNDKNGAGNSSKDDKSSGAANSGCGQSEPTSSGQSGSATITIKGFSFGQPVTVAPGATVEVVNTDAAPHNVTATDKSFKTSTINQDEKTTFTAPTTPGRYEFSCTIHPEMTGTLIVDAGGGQGRSRSSEPAMGSQRSGGSGGEHGGSGQHQSTAPGRENPSGGSSNGY
jgi:plastocyanin